MLKLKRENGRLALTIIAVVVVLIIIVAVVLIMFKNNNSNIATEEGIKIPLPNGFKNTEITNKINEGIVIEDEEGNQFVWVPVNFAEFKRKTFGLNATPLGYPIYLVDENRKEIQWEEEITKPYIEERSGGIWEATSSEEYKEMLDSVEKYGGFYIGRYLASYSSGESIDNYKPGSIKSIEKYEKKEDFKYNKGTLWNWVSPEESRIIANKMYEGRTDLVSHIPYGIQYDVICQWFLDSSSRTLEELTENSSGWGNTHIDTFSQTIGLVNTGEFEETKTNNIYDISGNLFEWANEYYSENEHTIIRGNYYESNQGDDWNNVHAASRTWHSWNTGDNKWWGVGFRVALYVK